MSAPLKRPRLVTRASGRRETSERSPNSRFDSDSRFRALALAALDRQQFERGRLARKLHDDVAQILSGAGLQLDILKMDLRDRVPEIDTRTAEVQELLDRVVRQIRDLSYELNPDIVERAGLQLALDLLVGRFRNEFRGTVRLIYDSSVRLRLPEAVAMERIAQEAVANAICHSECGKVEIVVKSTREGAVLEVRDDGRGFDYEVERRAVRGLGLLMMEHCASKAGLQIRIAGQQDTGGATVRVVAAKKDSEGK